jgi:hypothetical protein
MKAYNPVLIVSYFSQKYILTVKYNKQDVKQNYIQVNAPFFQNYKLSYYGAYYLSKKKQKKLYENRMK